MTLMIWRKNKLYYKFEKKQRINLIKNSIQIQKSIILRI